MRSDKANRTLTVLKYEYTVHRSYDSSPGPWNIYVTYMLRVNHRNGAMAPDVTDKKQNRSKDNSWNPRFHQYSPFGWVSAPPYL